MINAFELARQNLHRSATAQAQYHERGGLKVRDYQVGDMVWRFYPPRANQKLGKPWHGPYVVEAVLPDWLVQIAKPDARDRPLWVHASCLKHVATSKR